MNERTFFRIGSVMAVVGAAGAFLLNVFHPRITQVGDLEAGLRMVGGSAAWTGIHVGLIFASLLVLGGLAALHRSITTEPGAAWARLGFLAAVVGIAVFCAVAAIDGMALKKAAVAWLNAPGDKTPDAAAVAQVLDLVGMGLFGVFIIVFFGIAFLLFGLGVVFSGNYPPWLGWIAIIGGLGSGYTGAVISYRGHDFIFQNILFPVFSLILTVWVLVMGILLWRVSAVRRRRW